ncbi:MAG: hypothetical protein JWM11_5428 [Planctomycetaceae bacterium]|nr:hypothetical protein [Planctomycetaceae bacterium]
MSPPVSTETPDSMKTDTLRSAQNEAGIFISATDAARYAQALGKILRAVPSPVLQRMYPEVAETAKLINRLDECRLAPTHDS